MHYKYSLDRSFEFLAPGSILYGAAGSPNFPVRLGNEIFHRSLELLSKQNGLTIYDPCCGSGYLLTTISILNADKISHVFGSDIHDEFVFSALKNLNLLNSKGLDQRKKELQDLYGKYEKDSHLKSLDYISLVRKLIQSSKIACQAFERDVLKADQLLEMDFQADIIISDLPYGKLVSWKGQGGIDLFLDNIASQLSDQGVVALIYDKYQKRTNQSFIRKSKFKVGKRVIELLMKA